MELTGVQEGLSEENARRDVEGGRPIMLRSPAGHREPANVFCTGQLHLGQGCQSWPTVRQFL